MGPGHYESLWVAFIRYYTEQTESDPRNPTVLVRLSGPGIQSQVNIPTVDRMPCKTGIFRIGISDKICHVNGIR